MAKPKRRYVCTECGSVATRWQGQCVDCSQWNTLVEDAPETAFSARHDLSSGGRPVMFEPLDAPSEPLTRRSTGLAEFDRALGGGIVPGSAILMGGEPGIGKSTLLLQAAAQMARGGARAVYISGEEATGQVRLRAARLGLADAPLQLAAATSVRDILTTLGNSAPPALLVVDSIQTMHSDTIEGAPGTVSQVRASAFELIRYAKENGSYGLATLQKRPIQIRGDTVRFDFDAKSGQHRRCEVVDPAVREVLMRLRRRRSGPESELLAHKGADGRWVDVRSQDINDYLKEHLGDEFTAKDFRTWVGTVLAAVTLAVGEEADGDGERRAAVKRATAEVADHLGNTPAVARSAYIDPRVVERFEADDVLDDPESIVDLGELEAEVIRLVRRA